MRRQVVANSDDAIWWHSIEEIGQFSNVHNKLSVHVQGHQLTERKHHVVDHADVEHLSIKKAEFYFSTVTFSLLI
jgi:predicted NAD-dependent protein-ADP-ribosyltransferase YbiA (DUF1768 family)